jgi:hypothetical protein
VRLVYKVRSAASVVHWVQLVARILAIYLVLALPVFSQVRR